MDFHKSFSFQDLIVSLTCGPPPALSMLLMLARTIVCCCFSRSEENGFEKYFSVTAHPFPWESRCLSSPLYQYNSTTIYSESTYSFDCTEYSTPVQLTVFLYWLLFLWTSTMLPVENNPSCLKLLHEGPIVFPTTLYSSTRVQVPGTGTLTRREVSAVQYGVHCTEVTLPVE
jgi:hypothetical protein